ncbi:MAG TPA: phage holin family protein [Baekduia sp.]|nr:phage holin family protein [Baekduia sp.]
MDDRSTGELLRDLSTEITTLVKQELELAKTETMEKGKKFGTGAGIFGAGGVIGLLSLAALTTAVIALLATAMDTWIAALIVAVVYAAFAACAALAGRRQIEKAGPLAPEATIKSTEEDLKWAKTQAQSGRK